ncbi:MAG: DUF418 domain-containing protein [Sphingomicrobium sp.]
MAQNQAATAARDRIDILDALRGFALLGILLANYVGFSGWAEMGEPARVALAGQAWAFWSIFLNTMLVEGKFYTIFSFLFGLGFALQLSRLENRGADGIATFRRRLLVLLGIGIVHMTLIWEGDILALYALLGFTLPFFRPWSERRLLLAAAILILLPVAGYAVVHAAGIPPTFGLYGLGERMFVAMGGIEGTNIGIEWRQREDWPSFFAWVLSGPPYRLGVFFESWRIPKVLGVMLIGVWAGRRLVAGELLGNRALLRSVALIGFLVGLPANAGYAAIGGLSQDNFTDGLLATVLYAVGVVPLGLAYAATFALLWPSAAPALRVFSSAGRMALTNYLLQSLFAIAIFYGVGFGLIGHVPAWTLYAIVAAVFTTQVLLSRFWLAHFEQGPMEWLWRLGTYGGQRPARAS